MNSLKSLSSKFTALTSPVPSPVAKEPAAQEESSDSDKKRKTSNPERLRSSENAKEEGMFLEDEDIFLVNDSPYQSKKQKIQGFFSAAMQSSLLDKIWVSFTGSGPKKYTYNFPLASFQVQHSRGLMVDHTPRNVKVVTFTVDPEMLQEDDFITILKKKIQEDAVELAPTNMKEINPQVPLTEDKMEANMEALQTDILANSAYRDFSDLVFIALQPSPEFKIHKVIFANPVYEQALSTVRAIHMEGHSMKDLPLELCKLENLQELYLGYNYIKAVPREIEKLTNLITLHLQHNQIEKLSRGLGNLTSLKSLWLSDNQISSVPAEIANLKLIGLHLHQNKLSALPLELRKMVSLQKLDVSANAIKSIAPIIEQMAELVKLDFSHNKVNELPGASLTNLVNLVELDADHNLISTLPSEIGYLQQLTTLNLSNNMLTSIPATLGKLTNLKSLCLSHNKNIALIPSSLLVELCGLTRLEIMENKIQSIPSEISKMTSLISLRLGQNNISSIPPELCTLVQIRELGLASNQIPSVPADICKMTSLQELDLQRNKIKALSTAFGDLTQLKKLYLNDNQIASIPPALAQLTNLSSLQLHYNPDLNFVPREIMFLTQLQELSVANIYVNDADKEMQILKEDTAQLKQFFNVVRCAPHRLLVFALTHFPANVHHQQQFEELGLLTDVLHMMLMDDTRVQYEATRVITALSELDHFQVKLFEEKALTALLRVASEAELATRIRALEAIGNLAFNDTIRKEIQATHGLTIFKELALKSEEEEIRRRARRILAIFGINEPLSNPWSPERGIRILSIDGGGTRGLVAVEILKKLEELAGKKIGDLFDLIGGTSTGGILACSLGTLGINATRCEELYLDLCGKVFVHHDPEANVFTTNWSRMIGGMNLIKTGGFYKAEFLEEVLSTHVGKVPMIDTSMDLHSKKVFCVSTLVSTFPPVIHLFRNYQYPIESSLKSRYQSTCRKRVCEALRASTAAPSYFDEYVDADKRHQDGGLMANNPTAIAIHEAKRIWPKRRHKVIVSIGTGKEPSKVSKTGLQGTLLTLIESATNVDRIDEVLADTLNEDTYFRFNPEHQIFECRLDETRVQKLEAMQLATREYIAQNLDRLKTLARLLVEEDQ